MKKITFNLFAAMFLLANICSAQSTGFMSPTDTAMPHGWTTPLNGMLSDAMWATAPHQSGCRCPFVYLSWDKGATYTSSMILGPYDTTDTWQSVGGMTNLWGHSWVDTEFSNTNFRVKVSNSSTLIEQGYNDFNFVIPVGASIDGIALKMQFHGDAGYTTDYLNAFQVNVFYTSLTGTNSIASSLNGITLFPNPAHKKITLQTSGVELSEYSLFSVDGRQVFDAKVNQTGNTFNKDIDLEGLSPGVYLIKIISTKSIEYRKVIVQ